MVELPTLYQELSFKGLITSLSLPFLIALLIKTIVIFHMPSKLNKHNLPGSRGKQSRLQTLQMIT